MNVDAVIAQLRSGIWPKNWQVYLYKEPNTIPWAVLGAVFLPPLILIILLGGIIVAGIVGVIAIIVLVIFLETKRRSTSQRPKAIKGWILVILPDGIIEGHTDQPDEFDYLHFEDIYKMTLAYQTNINGNDGYIRTKTNYWLDVYPHDGTYLKWYINEGFGDGAYIGKSIMAAYEHYWRQISLASLASRDI